MVYHTLLHSGVLANTILLSLDLSHQSDKCDGSRFLLKSKLRDLSIFENSNLISIGKDNCSNSPGAVSKGTAVCKLQPDGVHRENTGGRKVFVNVIPFRLDYCFLLSVFVLSSDILGPDPYDIVS